MVFPQALFRSAGAKRVVNTDDHSSSFTLTVLDPNFRSTLKYSRMYKVFPLSTLNSLLASLHCSIFILHLDQKRISPLPLQEVSPSMTAEYWWTVVSWISLTAVVAPLVAEPKNGSISQGHHQTRKSTGTQQNQN